MLWKRFKTASDNIGGSNKTSFRSKQKTVLVLNNVRYEGENIEVLNGKVYVDGNLAEPIDISSGILEVRVVEGSIEHLDTVGDVRCGDILGNVSTTGDVECGNVGGSISTTGDVSALTVHGRVSTVGDVNIRNV